MRGKENRDDFVVTRANLAIWSACGNEYLRRFSLDRDNPYAQRAAAFRALATLEMDGTMDELRKLGKGIW